MHDYTCLKCTAETLDLSCALLVTLVLAAETLVVFELIGSSFFPSELSTRNLSCPSAFSFSYLNLRLLGAANHA